MIKLERGELPPQHTLVVDGATKMRAEIARWSAATGPFSANLESSVWGSCKRDLQRIQHGKCCYCESKITASDHGAVEHYRPKNSVRDVSSHSGYWWLAYTWENLLFSCNVCNSSFKLTSFPLADESKRATDPAGRITGEEPLILDPFVDEPAQHIRFRKEAPAPLTERGEVTIRLCGLDRSENKANPDTQLHDGLQDVRREYYDTIKILYEVFAENAAGRLERLSEDSTTRDIIQDPEWQRRWDDFEKRILGPDAPYLAMIRQAFLDDFRLVI